MLHSVPLLETDELQPLINDPHLMSQGHNTDKEWLVKSVQEGRIEQYSEDDILDRILLGRGGYGVVFKGKMKCSGISVAMKTLFLNRSGREEELYKKFTKEVLNCFLYVLITALY